MSGGMSFNDALGHLMQREAGYVAALNDIPPVFRYGFLTI